VCWSRLVATAHFSSNAETIDSFGFVKNLLKHAY
jgi:hypothetical protein